MRTIIALVIVLALAGVASAAPFLVCDPQDGVETYQLTGLGSAAVEVAAQADGSLSYDLGSLAAGKYSLGVKACAGVWGCSASATFALSKPASIASPANVRLSGQ